MLPRAFAFDVFGTVVDWRTSVARESAPHLAALGRADLDPHRFADSWRARYQPAMAAVREGRRPWVVLDVLHREMLEATLAARGIDAAQVGEERLADWTRAWHRLDPWPDSVAGLERLRALAPVVTLSNGNVALMVAMARRAGLRWDAVLGAELARAYKPSPEAYLATATALALAPSNLCLVAAHHSDLAAARACGLLTAYIDRPREYGGAPAPMRPTRRSGTGTPPGSTIWRRNSGRPAERHAQEFIFMSAPPPCALRERRKSVRRTNIVRPTDSRLRRMVGESSHLPSCLAAQLGTIYCGCVGGSPQPLVGNCALGR